jgi:hypothetical protein
VDLTRRAGRLKNKRDDDQPGDNKHGREFEPNGTRLLVVIRDRALNEREQRFQLIINPGKYATNGG